MEQKIFDAVYAEIRPLLEENNFSEKDGVFESDTRSFKIAYNDEKHLFELLSAEVVDGTLSEFAVVSSYLFDEQSTAADAAAVGIDFNDTLLTLLGVSKRKTRTAEIALPQKTGGETLTVDDLANKLLAIFPAYKDTYKESVAENGELLYVNFFMNTVTNDIRELLEKDNVKKLKKIYDSLNELYVKGDRTVGNLVVVIVLGGALKGDKELTEKMLSGLTDFPHLKTAVRNISMRTKRDKKLREIYGI